MKPVLLAFLCCVGFVISLCYAHAQQPKFSELSATDSQRLDKQRSLIAAVVKQRFGGAGLTRTTKDLPILQRLIDERVFSESQTYELQGLGVVFGDVLASELPLRWEMITDEYGTDATLRFKDTSININAPTMISKRVEKGLPVNLSELLKKNRQELSKAQKRLR